MATNLFEFLRAHVVKSKDDPITHTRIGSSGPTGERVIGGKFYIGDEEKPEFYKHYYNAVFVNKQKEYLTEVQLRGDEYNHEEDGTAGPLLVDMDFRFVDCPERVIDDDVIMDIVGLYIEVLMELFNMEDVDVYVLQKPHINRVSDELVKDGVHIIFGVQVDHIIQQEIRHRIKPRIAELLDLDGENPFKITNTIHDILDEGISKGCTNWQMFGSRKPNNEAYELVHSYSVNIADGGYEVMDLDVDTSPELVAVMSAHYKGHKRYELKDMAKYRSMKPKPKPKAETVASTPSLMRTAFNFDVEDIDSIEVLDQLIKVMIDGAKKTEYSLVEAHDYTMVLPIEYSDSYDKWLRVGWALHNTDHRLFLTWMKFSAKSSKFSFSDISKYYEMWNEKMEAGLSIRSVMYWAKQDNPIGYNNVRLNCVDFYIERTVLSANEYDIAMVIFQLYKDRYRCADIKNKIWYEYKNHRWVEMDSGFNLRINISKELAKLYSDKSDNIIKDIVSKTGAAPMDVEMVLQGDTQSVAGTEATADNNEMERLRKKSLSYNKISQKLRQTSFKNNVMREAADLFYREEPDFLKKLDTNPYLLCFHNGVVDFSEKAFRHGRPDDYVSLCTHIDYMPPDEDISGEIHEFLGTLFPEDELRRYMWEHLASVLIGVNKNQTFNIYTGSGSNGKSKMVELMSLIMGDYVASVPISLVTSKRGVIGSVSPEIANLKGVRYAVMQEPSKNDRLNDGVCKELTGGDKITGRGLFSKPITFQPQFKLVVCTNVQFEIQTNDDGTWRRIRNVPYKAKYVEDPDKMREENPSSDVFYFKIDKAIDTKFARWKETFMSMLVLKAFETEGVVVDCDIVMKSTNAYRQRQDFLSQFLSDVIQKAEDGFVKRTDLAEEFKGWCQVSGVYAPKGLKELEEYMDKKYVKIQKKNGWSGCKIRVSEDDITATDVPY
jgi:P4 family phage/plasmid primase-like protien